MKQVAASARISRFIGFLSLRNAQTTDDDCQE